MSLTWDELTISPDAWTSTSEPAAGRMPVTRVYLRGARTAHYREHQDCTRHRDYDDWRGTGSQREYETAGRLALCPACFAWRENAGIADERLGTGHGTGMT